MPTPLLSAVESLSSQPVNSTLITQLIEQLSHFSPTCLDSSRSPHFYDVYQAKLDQGEYTKTLLMKCLLDYTNQLHKSAVLGQSIADSPASLANPSLSEKAREKITQSHYLLGKALLFAATAIGNCADRAAYAALQFFKLFNDTPIQVAVQSSPEYDQFVVYLGNRDMGWHIYDPLTNPSVLFAFKEYTTDVLPLFPKVTHPKQKFSLLINRQLVDTFEQQAPQTLHRLLAVLGQIKPEEIAQLIRQGRGTVKPMILALSDLPQQLSQAQQELLALLTEKITLSQIPNSGITDRLRAQQVPARETPTPRLSQEIPPATPKNPF